MCLSVHELVRTPVGESKKNRSLEASQMVECGALGQQKNESSEDSISPEPHPEGPSTQIGL